MTHSKQKFSTRVLSIIFMLVSVFTAFSVTQTTALAASATAFKQISSSQPMKTYIISTSNIPCYTSSSLSTRGTVTSGKSSTAYIAPSDDVYVISVDTTNFKWAKVTYPVGSKRYTAYIALSKITSNNSSHKKTTATGKVMTYKRANSSTGSSSMYISKGETVYLVATSGSYYQVLYPCQGGWRLAWVTKTNYNKYLNHTTHSYTTGYNSSHPHKQYKKCSACGYSYYTGNTKKVTSCTTCYPSTSYSYNSSTGVVTINGVSLTEYKVGTTYTSSRYASVNGKTIDMKGWQCIGYARYVQTKLYGCHEYNSNKFTKLSGSSISPGSVTASNIKSLVQKAGVGAHLRTGTSSNQKHSMIIANITSTGFTVIDANSSSKNPNKIDIRTYTWKSYANSYFGKQGVAYVYVYTG